MSRRLLALLLGVGIVATFVSSSTVTAAGDDVGAVSQTKTVTRAFYDAFGNETTVDSRDVTVKVDHTKNLQGRERVRISWSGARPSAARATNPFGEKGLAQEYPMVILQCRGRDDSNLPASLQVSPETCWTSTRQQRSQVADTSAAVWRLDPDAKDDDRGQVSGVRSLPSGCDAPGADSSVHLTPFRAASGKVYPACSAETMPPEAAVDSSYPAAEQAAYTGLDGKGETSFEVRSSIENESLGCNQATACSLVVVPIMGVSCLRGKGDLAETNSACRKEGQFAPGSSNFAGLGVDDSVSPLYWWSASNWDNRISVPITFGAAPNVCNVVDPRAPVGFYGTELMSQASLQWAPAYCLSKKRFKFQHNVQPDQASFTLMEQKEVPGAFVSGPQQDEGVPDPGSPEYAPTAVTGFAISYIIDKPDNAGEYTSLKLDARLLAKLLTESYPASALGRDHPGIGGNPLSINQDPEFQALNPGIDTTSREEAAVIMSLSESSDVIKAITQYIATDPEASSFIDGTPDPWGMKVNPEYKGISLPRSEWPLLDEYKATPSDKCLAANNDTPYLPRLAAPVTTFRKVAEALLDAWPLAQTKCSGDGETTPYVLGRADRQGVGSRLLIGVTTLGDAERFGLRQAALQTSSVRSRAKFTSAAGRTFVGPSQAGLAAAVKTAQQSGRGEPFDLDMSTMRRTKGAYPGTLVVYTAARTAGLDQPTANTVASFIRISSTEGQVPGTGNGFLPDGFLPIRRTGATAALFRSAQQVAADVQGQVGNKADGGAGGASTPGAGGDAGTADAGAGAAADDAPAEDGAAKQQQATSDQLKSLGSTDSLSSSIAGIAIPAMLLFGLLAGLGSPVVRLLAARRRTR